MVHGSPSMHLRGGVPPINHWKAGFHFSCQAFSRILRVPGQQLQTRIKGRISTLLGVITVACLVLAFAGCNGDDDGGGTPVVPGTSAPVANDDTATTNENTPVTINVLANDFDPDGSPLTVVAVVQPAHGTVVINPNNTVTYTPETNFSGTDAFAYTISDGMDGTDTATVTVTVVAVQQRLATPSRSTTIALTSDDKRAIVVNRQTHSLAIIEVRDAGGGDTANLIAEVAVGNEPRFVALSPDNQEAYVTNAVDGTVSVVALSGEDAFSVVAVIPVGTEPRGIAITPNGTRLYVANHTEGTVSIIDPVARSVIGSVPVGGNPTAVAITNNGDGNDQDERVFVSRFFAELIPGGPGEGFDTGKQGVVNTFPVANPNAVTAITLSPLANVGFTAN